MEVIMTTPKPRLVLCENGNSGNEWMLSLAYEDGTGGTRHLPLVDVSRAVAEEILRAGPAGWDGASPAPQPLASVDAFVMGLLASMGRTP
jgi:hypothetical protein